MDPHKETLETWNKVASLYEEQFMELEIYNETYDFVCRQLTAAQTRVLDAGCGPGNISRQLLSRRADLEIDGIDMAANMIDLAKKNNPGATFTVMDARAIGTLTKKYDAVICGFLLPYLSADESAQLINDASGLLDANGILYLSFVAGDAEQSGFKLSSTGYRSYFYYHQADQVKTMLSESGFEALKVFNVNYEKSADTSEDHTIMIARKT